MTMTLICPKDGSVLLEDVSWETYEQMLEPDECYSIQHFADVVGAAGTRELDLSKDPPPDLAIEIDITHRSIPRQPIYAALKVAEIWRWDGKRVVPLHRTRGGKYAAATRSLAFPELDFDLLNEVVQLALTQGQPAAIKTLRARLRGTPDPK